MGWGEWVGALQCQGDRWGHLAQRGQQVPLAGA